MHGTHAGSMDGSLFFCVRQVVVERSEFESSLDSAYIPPSPQTWRKNLRRIESYLTELGITPQHYKMNMRHMYDNFFPPFAPAFVQEMETPKLHFPRYSLRVSLSVPASAHEFAINDA